MTTTKKKRSGPRMPQLRWHRTKSGTYGYAIFDGIRENYGREDDPQTRVRFAEDLALWIANGRQFPADEENQQLAVQELVDRYRADLEGEHGDGWFKLGGIRVSYALDALVGLYGTERARDFGPRKLKIVRQHMVDAKLCRKEINARIGRVRACFAWGVAEELLPRELAHALACVKGLKAGGAVEDNAPRDAVDEETFRATLPHVSSPLDDVLRLMWATGARPSEILGLTPSELDQSDPELWVAVLATHKTVHHGKVRVLVFDKSAQRILEPYLLRPAGTPLFLSRNGHPFDHRQVHKAVTRAVNRINAEREEKGEDKIGRWVPYQVRHRVATDLAAAGGECDAQLVLGHSSLAVTRNYVHDLVKRTKEAAHRRSSLMPPEAVPLA